VGLLIDTNIFIRLERQPDRYRQFFEELKAEEISLSAITASELLHGVHRANDSTIRARREAFVEAILTQLSLVEIDLAIARQHARLWADLTRAGTMIGLHDSWIAATCLARDLTLVTFNRQEFARVPGLRMINLPD
jgi:tRNA(fMet)-specific endonuclease VapC